MRTDIDLHADEDLIGMVRRRPMVEFPRFLFAAAWIFAPFFFFFPLIALGPFGWFIFFLLFLSGCYYAAKRYVMWSSTMLLITTNRVIDIDQLGLRKRHIAELPYDQINAVHVRTPGLFGAMFKTGRVQVESRSMHSFDLEIMGIYKPESVRQLILDVQCLQYDVQAHDKNASTI
jgi:hypothetical protein